MLGLAVCLSPGAAGAEGMEWIRVGEDTRGFVQADSERPFVPWGFNYDRDAGGRLLEDYWESEWPTVEQDFREMRALGANVVRVHLQLGRFMRTADTPNQAALDRLGRLIRLAESLELYLDLTGLGCYHRQDVPAWYDALDERPRWDVQARFWEAVARTAADSPAIFCYDLMSEPVVSAGPPRKDWLGPAFAGKHYVQYITRDLAGRDRPAVARQWVRHLVSAVRRHDRRHLVTVGLVPWSLQRPGLTSGFVPTAIAGDLDFIAVHLYPETGKLDADLETLKGFAVGKPVVIEEMFPLKCASADFAKFLDRSEDVAAGWIGFYWGKTPEEYRESDALGDKLMLDWLTLFQQRSAR